MSFNINSDVNYAAYRSKLLTLTAEEAELYQDQMIRYLLYQATLGTTLSNAAIATGVQQAATSARCKKSIF